MTKKLIIIVVFLTVLTSGTLYSCSINNTKQAVVNNVKTVLQTKNDLQLAVIPSGDQEITINGKTHTIKNETFTIPCTSLRRDSTKPNQKFLP